MKHVSVLGWKVGVPGCGVLAEGYGVYLGGVWCGVWGVGFLASMGCGLWDVSRVYVVGCLWSVGCRVWGQCQSGRGRTCQHSHLYVESCALQLSMLKKTLKQYFVSKGAIKKYVS